MESDGRASAGRQDTPRPLVEPRLKASAGLLSLLALVASLVIAFEWPEAVEASPGLVWSLALVPALLWAHARGWRGSSAAAAGGMAALTLSELCFHLWLDIESAWMILGTATVVYIPVTLGAGWVSDIASRRVQNRRLYELAPVAMVVHLGERIVYGNLAARELAGVEKGRRLEGHSLLELVHPDEREELERRIRQLHDPSAPPPLGRERYRLVRSDGGERIVEMDSTGVMYGHGRAAQTVLRDVTAFAQLEEDLERRALYDALTELPNRHLLEDRLEHAIERSQRRSTDLAVLFIDLDGFKAVNDHFGHRAGDRVLRRVARRLEATLRQADTVARFGGDEFAVLLEDLDGPEEARLTAERLVTAFDTPLAVSGVQLPLGLSIGIAFGSDGPKDAEDLIARADEAMYAIKDEGGSGYRVYRSDGAAAGAPAPAEAGASAPVERGPPGA